MRIGQFFPQRISERARHFLMQSNLAQDVTVTFEKLGFLPVQSENMITIGRLKNAHQGFGMKAIGHNNQFGNRPLESVNPENAFRAQHRQPFIGVVPEFAVVSQCQKWFQ